MKRVTIWQLLICLVISTVAGVVVADILPARRTWNWTASATAVLIYIVLLFAFTRRRK